MPPQTLQEKLEELSANIEALIKPPLTILEVVDVAKALGEVVLEYNPSGTYEDQLENLKIAWAWAEEKYDLVDKLDDALKLPLPLEWFDGPLFKWAIPNMVLVAVAKAITKG